MGTGSKLSVKDIVSVIFLLDIRVGLSSGELNNQVWSS